MQAVIARSFAFIYGRNQPSLGLLGIVMGEEAFYELAVEGAEIEIDVPARNVRVGGKEFGFKMAEMEYRLTMNKGITEAYRRFGKKIWEKLTEGGGEVEAKVEGGLDGVGEGGGVDRRIEW